MIEKTYGLAFPVAKNPLGFFHSSTGLDVVKSDLMILLLTNPGERIMLPQYGTNLRRYFFETNDPTAHSQIKELIVKAIATWEPRVAIENISVGFVDVNSLNTNDNQTQAEHVVSIIIKFFDPNNIAQVDSLVLELPLPNGGSQ